MEMDAVYTTQKSANDEAFSGGCFFIGNALLNSLPWQPNRQARKANCFQTTAFKQLALNNKLLTVLVLNPLGRLASAGPGLASGRVTVFGSHLGATGAAACTARREHVLRSQAKFFYQRTNLAQRTGQLGAAGFADLFFKVFTLLEQFFVAGHVKHIQWVERCQL